MSNFLKTIAALFILTSGAYAQPKLVSSPENFDFGFSYKDAVIVHKCWLKSIGDDTVKITDIQTGCSCTTIPLKQKEIAPGDSVEIEIRWNTERTFGPVKRYPRIFYKSAEKPLRLALFTNVQNVQDSNLAVTIWPFRFELGKLPSKSIDSLEFRISNNLPRDLDVFLASHNLEKCDLFLPQLLSANSSTYGYIKIKPEYLDTEFEDSITLRFNHDPKYLITVPIRRKIYTPDQG